MAAKTVTIAAILLAAGQSRRFGGANKLLALGPTGVAMARQSAANLCQSAARPVQVVVGYQGSEVAASLVGLDLTIVPAAGYAEGMSASLRAGIASLPASCDGVLVCLGDMPLVRAATLNALIDAANAQQSPKIIVPAYRGQAGNPVLWHRSFFSGLLALSGDRGGRQLYTGAHAPQVITFELDDSAILTDFDVPLDWAVGLGSAPLA